MIMCFTYVAIIHKKNHATFMSNCIYYLIILGELSIMIQILLLLVIGLIGIFIYSLIKNTVTNVDITPLTNYDKLIVKNRIQNLTGREYEIFTAKMYELLGYKSILTPVTNDGGKDVILNNRGEKIFVECKHTDKKSIGRPAAQKLCGAMVADNITKGLIITLDGANKNCKEYCDKVKGKQVKIDSIKIISLMDLLKICSEIDAEQIFKILDLDRNDIIEHFKAQ